MTEDDAAVREIIYPEAKREDDRAVSPYIYYALRPFSVGPTLALHRRGVTANGCTALSALVLAAGVALLAGAAGPGWGAWVAGGLLINLYLYLDVLDGNLARLSRRTSRAGELADCTLNAIAGVAVPAALGVGLFLAGGDAAARGLGVAAEFLLAAGFAIGVLRLLRRVVTDHASRLVGAEGDRANVLGASRRGPRYWAAAVNSAAFPLLLAALVAAVPSVWLLFFLLYNAAVVPYTLYWAYRRVS